jgi:site-specific DNA-methyltransferase (adenine-specific)
MNYSESEITGLIKFDAAKQAIEVASSIDEVKDIRDRAEAFRAYAKQAHFSLGMQNKCCEIKVRAERRAGELLAETNLDKGGRPTKNLSHNASGLFKLNDIGISKDQSSRWQSISAIPESIFEEHIREVIEKEQELTSASLLSLGRDLKIKQRDDERRRKIYEESGTISVEDSGIFCGDCVQYMRDHMADKTVDLTVTSPPYGQIRDFQNYSFDFEATAKELFRVTKNGGVLVWIVGDSVVDKSETAEPFKQALFFKEVGFNLWDTMIYKKASTSFPSVGRYNQIFEFMFIFICGTPKTFNPLMVEKNWKGSWGQTTRRQQDGSLESQEIKSSDDNFKLRTNIWEYHNGYGFGTQDDIALMHPARFPEKLAEDHILSWSNPGDLVFDPMVGSGTTLKMAKINDRRFIGVDISEEYCDLARKRLAIYQSQVKM